VVTALCEKPRALFLGSTFISPCSSPERLHQEAEMKRAKHHIHHGRSVTSANGSTNTATPSQKLRNRLVWLTAGVSLAVAGFVLTYFLVDFVLWPRIPSALVGTWRSQSGQLGEVTLELRPNGAFKAETMVNGVRGGFYATAEVEDKLLHSRSVNTQTRKEEIKIHIIKSLTKNEMQLEDPTGTVHHWRQAGSGTRAAPLCVLSRNAIVWHGPAPSFNLAANLHCTVAVHRDRTRGLCAMQAMNLPHWIRTRR
jgi:hypothetical protein